MNCVPRELVFLSAVVEPLLDPISVDNFQKWIESRAKDFISTAKTYYDSLSLFIKERFYTALLQWFLGSTSAVGFGWELMDLGLVYRSKDISQIGLNTTFYAALSREPF